MTARIDPPEHDLEREQDFVEREDCEGMNWPDCDCKGCQNACPYCGAELITKRAGDESWRVCGDAACGYEEN